MGKTAHINLKEITESNDNPGSLDKLIGPVQENGDMIKYSVEFIKYLINNELNIPPIEKNYETISKKFIENYHGK